LLIVELIKSIFIWKVDFGFKSTSHTFVFIAYIVFGFKSTLRTFVFIAYIVLFLFFLIIIFLHT